MAMTLSPTGIPRRSARPPGPKGHWFWGSGREFVKDRLGFLTQCAREYGDVAALRLGRRQSILLSHPDLIEEVLVTQSKNFIKHFALRSAKRSLGEGLLTSEGDFWRRQRKLAQPAFQRERTTAHAGMMVAFTERMLESWRAGQTRDVQDDMMRLTLEIVAKALFGADVAGDAAEVSAAMETTMRCFTARLNRIIRPPDWVPTPVNLRMKRAVDRLDKIIFRIIAERRAGYEGRGDLLSLLLQARDEDDGRRMSEKQLRDEAMTLFMAGHETTANTLAWTFYLLSLHPDAETRLHAELDTVLGGRPPTLADLPRLPYTELVITEALRVLPTVWLLGREALEPCSVGGYHIPAGTTLWMSQWVVHRDARFFDEPESFRPERWADGLAKRIPRYAYFPFGGGPRICIGNHFALMESALLLATIAGRYRLELVPGTVVRPWPSLTLRPDGGLPMIVHDRR